jgi:hypothetical protein
MASTDIKWTCTAAEDPFYPIAENQETLLYGFWAGVEGNGSDAAKGVAEDYFDTATWAEWFGDDDGATVRIAISHPEAAAGVYEVEMERTVKAITAKLLVETGPTNG